MTSHRIKRNVPNAEMNLVEHECFSDYRRYVEAYLKTLSEDDLDFFNAREMHLADEWGYDEYH